MRYAIIIVLLAIIVSAVGCFAIFRAPVMPPIAAGFMDVEAPIDTNFDNTTIGDKRGEAQHVGIMGLLSFGDCSVRTAARQANIKRIDHVGYHFTNILCFVTIWKTTVYGE